MRKMLALAFMIGIVMVTAAQKVPVTIQINGSTGEPLKYVTIAVFSPSDTLKTTEAIADSAGRASFQLNDNQPYVVRASYINYLPLEKTFLVKGPQMSLVFEAEPAASALQGVVVTATRPLMRQEDDKTIVDPENLALSSTHAYEILEKTPGLFVDQDGNVYLSSATPARVLINGREQRMSAADLATILKSLPPNAIAQIEILRTPSARYDASGSGGVVNVVLRKGVRIGLTGSVNAGFNQGVYGNQFAGISINNVEGKWNQHLNFQYTRRNSFDNLVSSRVLSPDSLLTQDATTRYPAHSYYLGYGVGYQFTDKWELGWDGRYSANRSFSNSENISAIVAGSNRVSNLATINNEGRSFSLVNGLNLKHKIDEKGSEWTADLSLNYNSGHTDQQFETYYNRPVVYTTSGMGDIENISRFFSAQSNLTQKFTGLTFETGLKSTLLNFNNATNYFRTTGGSFTKDGNRTGAYDYRENINAAYLQASRNLKVFILKAGVRAENTNMSGSQRIPRDTSFALHRTDLFPYIYLSRPLMKVAGYDVKAYLVYRRTITRPSYDHLNPSIRYVDPYLFETGNPTLRPQFTSNYEANISVDERPIFAFGVNEQRDIFTQVLYQADSSRSQAFRTYDNVGRNKETYFRAIGAIPPGKKYFFVVGAQYNHNAYQGLYESKPIDFTRGSWTVFTYHSLRITPTTQFSMHGFARFKGQLQFYELGSFGQANVSLNQQLLRKKMTLALSVSDIFYTNRNDFTLQQGSVRAFGSRRADTRRFGLNLRYNFGIGKKEEKPAMPNLDAMQQQ